MAHVPNDKMQSVSLTTCQQACTNHAVHKLRSAQTAWAGAAAVMAQKQEEYPMMAALLRNE
jgi:hypothetical protein